MKVYRIWLLIVVGMLICSGCASTGPNVVENTPPPREGEQKLSAGIKSYEEGNYKDSAKLLQEALAKGLRKEDQVKAHKYMAFIHCASEQKKECADEFKKALELDPNFELQEAEAGHPLWGPVYTGVKGTKAMPAVISTKPPTKEVTAPPSNLAPKEAQAAELPSTALPSPKILVVVKTSHMRAEANNKSKIIRILKKGEKVEYLGKSESGDWFNCKLPLVGLTGWVFKDLVQEAK